MSAAGRGASGGSFMSAAGRGASGGSFMSAAGRGASSAGTASVGTVSGGTGGSGASTGMPSAAGTSNGGSSPDVPPSDLPPANWDTLKLVLTGTTPPCTSSTCHGNAGGKGGFGFPVKNDAQLYTQLTTHVVKDCGSIPLVTPGDPEKSALIMVLSGPCSDDLERMPRGCTDVDGNCVPPEYIDALAQWIAEGAAHP